MSTHMINTTITSYRILASVMAVALLPSSVLSQNDTGKTNNRTEAELDGEGLFAEMSSRKDSLEDAKKAIADVFDGFGLKSLCKAEPIEREDGRPDVKLDPNSGSLKIPVCVTVDDEAFQTWKSNAIATFTPLEALSDDANGTVTIREESSEREEKEHEFRLKRDVCPVVKDMLEKHYAKLCKEIDDYAVRVVLVDKQGKTIASKDIPSSQRFHLPINMYAKFNPYRKEWFDLYFEIFQCIDEKDIRMAVFEGLPLDALKSISRIVCDLVFAGEK